MAVPLNAHVYIVQIYIYIHACYVHVHVHTYTSFCKDTLHVYILLQGGVSKLGNPVFYFIARKFR